jgi:hypothetical protein
MMKVGHHIRRAKKLKQKMKINPRVKVWNLLLISLTFSTKFVFFRAWLAILS